MAPGMEPGMEPGMDPGGIDPGMAMPPDAGGPGDVGGPGMGTGTQEESVEFEDVIDPSAAVVTDALYTLGADGIIYGFSSLAPDNVAPTIADPLLEVPGASRQRAQFDVLLADEADFPERYAADIEVPGTPPIFLSVLVRDEGSGVNPETVKVTVNDEPADYTYDAREGLVWYIYDPRGAAANLANGIKRIVIEAEDWRGNRVAKAVAFTVNNKLKAPAPPKPKTPTFDEGGFPGEVPPEFMP